MHKIALIAALGLTMATGVAVAASDTKTEEKRVEVITDDGRQIIIENDGKDGDRQRRVRIERHGGPGGPAWMFGGTGPMAWTGAGERPGTVVRCTRTDQPDGPGGEKRYQMNCSERKLEKGETVYVRPDFPPMPPAPPTPPAPPAPRG